MALLRYQGSLSTLFPPDEESSPWLVRLAMIRHDLRFEVSQLPLDDDATDDDVFRTTYFLRRMSISVLEAENVLGRDLGQMLKRGRGQIPAHLANAIEALRAIVTAARPVIEEVRNVIGGHMRTKNDAEGQPTIAREVLRTHHGWTLDVAIDEATGRETDMRDVAMATFLFAWPSVTDDASLDAKHGEYKAAMLSAARGVMHLTDALLFAYWSDLGITPTKEGS